MQCLVAVLLAVVSAAAVLSEEDTDVLRSFVKTFAKAPEDKTFLIYRSKSDHLLLQGALEDRGFVQYHHMVHKNPPKFVWAMSCETMGLKSEGTITNHFSSVDDVLASKISLHRTLAKDPPAFYPESLILDESTTAKQVAGLLQGDSADSCVGQQNCVAAAMLFIAKPAEGTRGVGIQVLESVDQVLALRQADSALSFLIQRYIPDPLLFRGVYKFDIRQFVLVTSLKPLQVFVLDRCYARLATVPYSPADVTNRFVHLTNHQVQKDSPSYHDTGVAGNQLDLESMKEILFRNGEWESEIAPQIQTIVRKTVNRWGPAAHRNESFELLGFDLLVDSNRKVWLLEVNASPGLHVLTDVVRVHHRQAVEGIAELMLDRSRDQRLELTEGDNVGGWTMVLNRPGGGRPRVPEQFSRAYYSELNRRSFFTVQKVK